MNALDKMISWAMPRRGLDRARARMQLSQVRKYNAAAAGRRTDGWTARGLSANAEISSDLIRLRDRSRELVRNNPWASRAVQAIVSNVVSYGITAKVSGSEKLKKRWKEWAETTACDADGLHDIYGLQALIMRTVVESGECLIRRRTRRPSDGFPVPLQIQVIEPDYLDQGKTQLLDGGGWITQGIQFSAIGQRTGYWLYSAHPGDQTMRSIESHFVPASEVAHVYRADRPGQARGVPWSAPVMLSLRDLDDYEDAYLFRQKLANCQVGVISDSTEFAVDSGSSDGIPELGETMEPGRYDFLPSGKDIKFNTPPDAGDYGPFTKDVLLRVAAGYGITYQALTGDLSSVNFSSGRMGWIEMHRNIESWRWQMLIPQGCNVISGWFIDAASMQGADVRAVKFTWTPPRREMLDPTKELKSIKDAVKGGLLPLPAALRQLGEDADEVLEEYIEFNKKLDKADVEFDTDTRAKASEAP